MAGELWGFTSGQEIRRDQDLKAEQIAQQGRLGDAHIKAYEAEARKADRSTKDAAAIQRLLATTGELPQGTDPLQATQTLLGQQSLTLAKAGYAKEAADVADKLMQMGARGATIRATDALEANRVSKDKREMLSDLNQLLSGVTDGPSFTQAKLLWTSRYPGVPIPKGLDVYNPATIEALKNGSAEGLKRLDLERKEAGTASAEANRDSAISFRDWRKKFLETQEADRRDLAERKVKAAGDKIKDPGSPPEALQATAAGQISARWPNLPKEELSEAKYTVASRALALRKTTGMDAAAAMAQALEEAAPNFTTSDAAWYANSLTSAGQAKSRYKAPGGLVNPLPLPQDKAGLKDGQHYIAKGGVWQYNAKTGKMVEVQAGPAKPGGKPAAKPAAASSLPIARTVPDDDPDLLDEE